MRTCAWVTHAHMNSIQICFLANSSLRERSSITSASFFWFWTPHPPCVSIISASLDPPPPICWPNTWIEGELLDDLYDEFQIIQICFSIIIRNRFLGVGAVFKDCQPEDDRWVKKKMANQTLYMTYEIFALQLSVQQLNRTWIGVIFRV